MEEEFGYVIFYNFEFYLNHPMEIIKIWNGGMSFHGGLLGIVISTYAFCINQKRSFFDLTDLLALVAPIGIFFGRIANFVNGELYGRITESSMGIIFQMVVLCPDTQVNCMKHCLRVSFYI